MNNESFHRLAPKWYIIKTLVKNIKVRVNWLKNNVLAVLTLLFRPTAKRSINGN